CSRRSNPRRREPPPVITIPRSKISAASSGGVLSKVIRTASTMVSTVSASASVISREETVTTLGKPVTRSLPFTSANSSWGRSEEHTSELQSRENLVCRLLLEKKNILTGCAEIYRSDHVH